MPRGSLKKFASLFLIVTILAASGLCSCLDSHAAQPSAASAATGCDGANHCPESPCDDHSDADHDDASCFCSCHLPLLILPMDIRPSQIAGKLAFFERFTAVPEVFLPKFIPPQNLA
ncbi:MAG TPA: hypothetical protein VK187_06735 [Geobacteraceae bacterium]|nr:hypothetical protein [Geobacteraceae bacterium]